MGLVIVVVVIVVAVVVGAAALVLRRSRSDAPSAPTTLPPPRAVARQPDPMTGLESALDEVLDRSGRPIREAIDAEASHVDELRSPDDTGPLLGRALDEVARPPHDDDPA